MAKGLYLPLGLGVGVTTCGLQSGEAGTTAEESGEQGLIRKNTLIYMERCQ